MVPDLRLSRVPDRTTDHRQRRNTPERVKVEREGPGTGMSPWEVGIREATGVKKVRGPGRVSEPVGGPRPNRPSSVSSTLFGVPTIPSQF